MASPTRWVRRHRAFDLAHLNWPLLAAEIKRWLLAQIMVTRSRRLPVRAPAVRPSPASVYCKFAVTVSPNFAARAEARCSRLLEVCREPRTAAELRPKRFFRYFRFFQLLFPMGETIACPKHSIHEGRLARYAAQDSIRRFVRAARDQR